MTERVRIGRLDRETWTKVIDAFDDANLYQTWSYGRVRQGAKHVEHAVVEDADGRPLAAAQVWLRCLPLLKCGVAYVKWGPLWLRRDHEPDPGALRQMVLALREEYAIKRRLLLRITPNQVVLDQPIDLAGFFADLEFTPYHSNVYRTVVADLRPAIEDIRKGFKRNFKANLGKSERHGIRVQHSTDIAHWDTFMELFRQMQGRKKFQEFTNLDDMRAIQLDLPEHHKLRIYRAELDGRIVSVIAVCFLGRGALYIHGATANDSLTTNASFLLHWHAIQDLKAQGSVFYDTCGVNVKRNPGGYQFKSGLGGKLGREFDFLDYETCEAQLSCLCFHSAEKAIMLWRNVLRFLRAMQRRLSPDRKAPEERK